MILGDPGYPLLPWLLTPFIGLRLSAEKESFNCYHSSARISVENAFGRLKARWRILGKKIDTRITLAPDVIAACCVLHNVCEDGVGRLEEMCTEDQGNSSINTQPQHGSLSGREGRDEGEKYRNALLTYCNNNLPLRQSTKWNN